MPEEPTQAQLDLKVERFRSGCDEATHFLRARFLNLAKRCAYKHLVRAEDVEDVVEEAFTRLWSRRSTAPTTFDGLRVYFLRVVENCAIDFVRRTEEVRAARQGVKLQTGEFVETVSDQPESDDVNVEAIVSTLTTDFVSTLTEADRHLVQSVCSHLARTPQPKMQAVYRAVGQEVRQNHLYVRNRWSRVQKGLKAHLGHQLPPKATRLILTFLGNESGHHC